MRTLTLGILAHVDASKATLTRRLLAAAGVIDRIGSVDDRGSQTDSFALERQRGLTITPAAVSLVIGDVTSNLIDPPDHPDVIAVAARSPRALVGIVLVTSGMHPRARRLAWAMRAALSLLIFVNTVDRLAVGIETRSFA